MSLKSLPTEQRNKNTLNIDEVGTYEMLKMINSEDEKVAPAVGAHLEDIAAAVDAATQKYASGGRIVYCGAGTSGRIGLMDASECPPTYGVPKESVVALMAGGSVAVGQAVESMEDKKEYGERDLREISFNKNDVLVGIAASGRTPYVIGAMEYAKSLGALTVSVTCNDDRDCPINALADYPIGIYPGPEAITGSTRMKAGTVQKLVLNMLSTGVMVKTGKVYGNLMVNVQVKNEKLRDRAERIIGEITGAQAKEIKEALSASGDNVALSIFMLMTGCDAIRAREYMERAGGRVKDALAAYNKA